jgi:hypothetical protein
MSSSTKRKFHAEQYRSVRAIFKGWDAWGIARQKRRREKFRKSLKDLLPENWMYDDN